MSELDAQDAIRKQNINYKLWHKILILAKFNAILTILYYKWQKNIVKIESLRIPYHLNMF
jgi:hypothetical protein